MFAILGVASVKYKRDNMSHYEAEIGEISLVPYNSYYDNFMVPLDKSMPLKIILLKKTHPVLFVENSKVIYMSRVIQEIRLFKIEIEREIAEHARNIANYKVLQARNTLQGIDLPWQNKRIMSIKFHNSCLILPRACDSKDVVVMLFDSAEVRIGKCIFITYRKIILGKENQTFKIPSHLEDRFAVVSSNLVVTETAPQTTFITQAVNTKININNANICYSIEHRNIQFGQTEKCVISISTPFGRISKDGWNLEPKVDVEMEDFSFRVNIVRLLIEIIAKLNMLGIFSRSSRYYQRKYKRKICPFYDSSFSPFTH